MTETWIEDPYFRAGFRIPDSGKARGKLSYARLGDNLRTKKAMRQNRLYWVMSLGIGMCSQKCPVVYAQVGHVLMSRPGSASLPVWDHELILSGLSEALIIMLAAPVLGRYQSVLSFKPGLLLKLVGYCLGKFIVIANVSTLWVSHSFPSTNSTRQAGFRIPDEFPMIWTGDGNGHRTAGSLNLSPFHGELQNP